MKRISMLAIFWGAFLSFGLQPMAGRTLLPYFGGTASVWVTCLCAFQTLFLAGYWYAFVPAKAKKRRVVVHLLAITAAGCLLAGFGLWKNVILGTLAGLNPLVGVLMGVAVSVGMAMVVLSANSTVVQSWSGGGREVYRLYAVGNMGSFVGLLVYPLCVEPFVPIRWQWMFFAVGTWVYAALLTAVWMARRPEARVEPQQEEETKTSGRKEGWWLWVAIPMVTSALLTATTAHLTNDFTPLPLLWAALLGIFLLSWVVGFSRIGEKMLPALALMAAGTLFAAGYAMIPQGVPMRRFYWNLGAAFAALLIVCGTLHGWLFRVRPEADLLRRYYLCIAVGGAAGGLLCGVCAPMAFESIAEYPLSLVAAGALLGTLFARLEGEGMSWLKKLGWGILGLAFVYMVIAKECVEKNDDREIWRERGFHGVISVRETTVRNAAGEEYRERWMYNGTTSHGFQVLQEGFKRTPTMYYGQNGGGIAFRSHPSYTNGTPMCVGMVGMGVGTLAVYGREGDVYRFWEISPEVIGVATNADYFTFLSQSKAKVEIVEADGRLALEQERHAGGERYDILVIDAFTGDSVPTHLITKEAFQLYVDLLKDDGILALHVSNWHIDLWPTMKAAAKEFGLWKLGTYSLEVPRAFMMETGWTFMARKSFTPTIPDCCQEVDWDKVRDMPLITDDCGSLLFNIRFGVMPPFKGNASIQKELDGLYEVGTLSEERMGELSKQHLRTPYRAR